MLAQASPLYKHGKCTIRFLVYKRERERESKTGFPFISVARPAFSSSTSASSRHQTVKTSTCHDRQGGGQTRARYTLLCVRLLPGPECSWEEDESSVRRSVLQHFLYLRSMSLTYQRLLLELDVFALDCLVPE